MAKLILCSKSPRRRELLELCGFDFLVRPTEVDESEITSKHVGEGYCPNPSRLVQELAMAKARAGREERPEDVVIGADTLVVLKGIIYGKPESPESAYEMLRSLSGKMHEVYTGVTISGAGEEYDFVNRSQVTFHPWDPQMKDLIESYIASGEPFDKAGGYGIQGRGALLIRSLKGDFYSVMGFPVAEVYRILMTKFAQLLSSK